ncbi:hypothetical protein ACHHYP_00881 [Achlya hypogyna]|uniref:Uncharacterized protein n=1 Tax=Achlya hypogyna TaxID=1202772 RepID=A0A1V9ZAH2_ACHHY|nr:hypothetical protein ACHHYP_00881 [Achlya hypogyna]
MLTATTGRWLRHTVLRSGPRLRFLHASAARLDAVSISTTQAMHQDLWKTYPTGEERLQVALTLIGEAGNNYEGVASDVLYRLSAAKDVARAKGLVEAMHENDVLASAAALAVFARVYFGHHTRDLPSALQWLLENHQALLSPTQELPLQAVLEHLVAQGQAPAAVEFWLLWADTLLEPPTIAIAALCRELVRFEQFDCIYRMGETKHKAMLQSFPPYQVALMEARVGARQYAEATAYASDLQANGTAPSLQRFRDLAETAAKASRPTA